MANTNCLEGIKCPDCGNGDSFRIAVKTVATFSDDGMEDHGDLEWDENSYIDCTKCFRHGTVKEFDQNRVQAAVESAADRPSGRTVVAEGASDAIRRIRRELADHHHIAIFWNVDDVRSVRPDFDDDQAWELLLQLEREHDGDRGITWDVIESASQEKSPNPGVSAAIWPDSLTAFNPPGQAFYIVPHREDGDPYDPMLEPCPSIDATCFRVVAWSDAVVMEIGDFSTVPAAEDHVRLNSGGKGMGRLIEGDAYLRLREEREEAKRLPSPAEIIANPQAYQPESGNSNGDGNGHDAGRDNHRGNRR